MGSYLEFDGKFFSLCIGFVQGQKQKFLGNVLEVDFKLDKESNLLYSFPFKVKSRNPLNWLL